MTALPPWIVHAVMRAADRLTKLRRSLLPPRLAAIELATMSWMSYALAAFCELGIPDRLAHGPRTPSQLAAEGCGDERMLFRLLRALAGYDVVRYVGGGRFALGRAGKGVAGGNSVRPMVLYANTLWHARAYANLAEAVRRGRSGFEVAHGTSMFQFLAEHSADAQLFDEAMQSLTPFYAQALAAAYDFSIFAHVVDIGGGTGALLAALLGRFPELRGTVFELSGAAQRAREYAAQRHVEDRLEVVCGDIFSEPPPAADCYILSHVLHDWNDADCIRILHNVRRAMRRDARLFVYEIVAAPPNNRWSQDRITDIEMMTMLGGLERTREEFADLFAKCGLRLARVLSTAAPESVIEVKR